MTPYLTWLLKNVLPHLAAQHRVVKLAHDETREMAKQFDRRRREYEERMNLLQAMIDDCERLCRSMGVEEAAINAATQPRHLCEEVPHAEG